MNRPAPELLCGVCCCCCSCSHCRQEQTMSFHSLMRSRCVQSSSSSGNARRRTVAATAIGGSSTDAVTRCSRLRTGLGLGTSLAVTSGHKSASGPEARSAVSERTVARVVWSQLLTLSVNAAGAWARLEALAALDSLLPAVSVAVVCGLGRLEGRRPRTTPLLTAPSCVGAASELSWTYSGACSATRAAASLCSSLGTWREGAVRGGAGLALAESMRRACGPPSTSSWRFLRARRCWKDGGRRAEAGMPRAVSARVVCWVTERDCGGITTPERPSRCGCCLV